MSDSKMLRDQLVKEVEHLANKERDSLELVETNI